MHRLTLRVAALALVLVLVPGHGAASDHPIHRSQSFPDQLAFEATWEAGTPPGFGGGPEVTIHRDGEIVHSGDVAVRIERDADSAERFTSLAAVVPVDFAGDRIELREDSQSGTVEFDNMQDRGVVGTTDWASHRIELPLNPAARTVFLGVLLAGTGTLWVDDLELLVDGTPVQGTEIVAREQTVLDLDHEFDDGSGVHVTALSPVQVRNLDLLGRVWGFLKYHHPAVTSGTQHWDYDLFRVLPRVLDAPHEKGGRRAILEWARSLGVPPPCDPCADAPEAPHITPDLAWMDDRARLGEELHAFLATVHERRSVADAQFYVQLAKEVGNPVFDGEAAYRSLDPVDTGYRFLALFRVWNIIQYWFPYRDVIGHDWNRVLPELLPTFAAADDHDAYELALLELIARVNDTHANLWSGLGVLPPRGDCHLPVTVRFVEGRAVVDHVAEDPDVPLMRGDVLLSLDGEDVSTFRERWGHLYAASNEETRLRDIARFLTRGTCGPCSVRVERADGVHDLVADRVLNAELPPWHERSGGVFQLLSEDVAYLRLSLAKRADAASYVERARGTRGLVLDLRCYPAENIVYRLGPHFVEETTPFVRFTYGDPSNPGAFVWTDVAALDPAEPRYEGRVVILVDELTQSRAEYNAMGFRVAPDALVVGSTTAGADGNASWYALPGGERSMISGIGIFYPDRTPTQRVGIVPDVVVRPTIEGIRAGRDEVLEEAIRRIVGEDVPEDDIRRWALR